MHANLDQESVDRFEQTANQWWDVDGPAAPLHMINPVRLKFLQEYTALAHKNILDVGCGGGLLTEAMAQAGATTTGIDAGSIAIEIAREHARKNSLNISYQLQTAESWRQEHSEHYDLVTCMELIEHVPKPATLVSSCADLCKQGGYVSFSTINRTLKAWLMTVIGAEYVLKLLPKGTHDYQQFIKPSELAAMGRNVGLELVCLKGMTLSSLKLTPGVENFRLSDDVSSNYIILFTKI